MVLLEGFDERASSQMRDVNSQRGKNTSWKWEYEERRQLLLGGEGIKKARGLGSYREHREKYGRVREKVCEWKEHKVKVGKEEEGTDEEQYERENERKRESECVKKRDSRRERE